MNEIVSKIYKGVTVVTAVGLALALAGCAGGPDASPDPMVKTPEGYCATDVKGAIPLQLQDALTSDELNRLPAGDEAKLENWFLTYKANKNNPEAQATLWGVLGKIYYVRDLALAKNPAMVVFTDIKSQELVAQNTSSKLTKDKFLAEAATAAVEKSQAFRSALQSELMVVANAKINGTTNQPLSLPPYSRTAPGAQRLPAYQELLNEYAWISPFPNLSEKYEAIVFCHDQVTAEYGTWRRNAADNFIRENSQGEIESASDVYREYQALRAVAGAPIMPEEEFVKRVVAQAVDLSQVDKKSMQLLLEMQIFRNLAVAKDAIAQDPDNAFARLKENIEVEINTAKGKEEISDDELLLALARVLARDLSSFDQAPKIIKADFFSENWGKTPKSMNLHKFHEFASLLIPETISAADWKKMVENASKVPINVIPAPDSGQDGTRHVRLFLGYAPPQRNVMDGVAKQIGDAGIVYDFTLDYSDVMGGKRRYNFLGIGFLEKPGKIEPVVIAVDKSDADVLKAIWPKPANGFLPPIISPAERTAYGKILVTDGNEKYELKSGLPGDVVFSGEANALWKIFLLN